MNYIDRLFNLKNKVVIVTGASGQLGSVMCKAFNYAGAIGIATDISDDCDLPDEIEFYKMDVTQKNDVQNVFQKVIEKHERIDILINNAGVSTFEDFKVRPEEKIDFVMDVNLKGTFFCIQAYVNLFDQFKLLQGSVINIGSIFGTVSPDYRNYTDCERKNSEIYGATKAGVIQMTKYFAVHLAEKNIRVNAVSPGGIFNPDNPQGEDFIANYSFRTPMNRMGKDSEIVGAILYLASDTANYTTGQNIVIDGGLTSW